MIELYNEDNIIGLRALESESVDCVLTDPPYLYLKNQKLEREFNELEFFTECQRVLKKDGFIVLFGRGTSFYRWNTILADLGFQFKEEVIWDKCYVSSPLHRLMRVHETISIHTKGNGIINKVKVPYLELKKYNIDSIVDDVKRLKTVFSNTKEFEELEYFLKTNVQRRRRNDKCNNYKVTMNVVKDTSRVTNVMNSMRKGMILQSIISHLRDHYNTIHPTQKPVKLLQLLLQLTTKEGDLVIDPFAGSFSTAEACMNLGLNFKGFEIDKEYFENGKKRIEAVGNNLFDSNRIKVIQ